MKGANCSRASAFPSAPPRAPRSAKNEFGGPTPRAAKEDYGNQGMGRKTEAPAGTGQALRRHSPAAQEGKELRRAGQAPARRQPDPFAQPLRADRPIARVPAEIQGLAHHASRAGPGRKDSGASQSQLVT